MPGGFLGCQEGGRGGLGNFSPIQGAEGLEGGAELAVAEGGAEPLLEETLQAQDGLHVRLVLGGEIKGLKGVKDPFGIPPGGVGGLPTSVRRLNWRIMRQTSRANSSGWP